MAESPRIILSEGGRGRRPAGPGVPLGAIRALGVALFCVGLLDMVLLWIPLQFGVAEWEFGTVSRFLDGLPVLTMAVAILIVLGGLEARNGLLWFSGSACVLLFLGVVIGALLYALNIPLALKATDQALRLGLKKGIVKALGEAVVYSFAFLALSISAFRMAKRS